MGGNRNLLPLTFRVDLNDEPLTQLHYYNSLEAIFRLIIQSKPEGTTKEVNSHVPG